MGKTDNAVRRNNLESAGKFALNPQEAFFPGFLSFCGSKPFLLFLVGALFGGAGPATFRGERRASRRKQKHRENTRGKKHAKCFEQTKDCLPTTKETLRENNIEDVYYLLLGNCVLKQNTVRYASMIFAQKKRHLS